MPHSLSRVVRAVQVQADRAAVAAEKVIPAEVVKVIHLEAAASQAVMPASQAAEAIATAIVVKVIQVALQNHQQQVPAQVAKATAVANQDHPTRQLQIRLQVYLLRLKLKDRTAKATQVATKPTIL